MLRCHFAASLRCSLGHRKRYSGRSGEIAGRDRQLEVLVNPFPSAEDGLPDAPHRLAPARVLPDPFADSLALPVSERPAADAAPAQGRQASPA